MLVLSRLIVLLTYAGAALLFGMALGGRGELGVVQQLFTVVIPLAAAVLALVTKKGRLDVLFTGLAMMGGLLLGQRQFDRAWLECLERAEGVRAALIAHDAAQGAYPARLEELETKLPCRCGFRRTILHYLSNDRGFRLWISNDRQTFFATDRVPFTASGRSSAPPPR